VRAAFAPWPVEKVDVAETEDHDGEPVFKASVGLGRVADDLDLSGSSLSRTAFATAP
jgi:hypothetical protein